MNKRFLTKISALVTAGVMLIPSAAVFADSFSVEKIEVKASDSQEFTEAAGNLQDSPEQEEGMLAISADTLVRMTLKLAADGGAGVASDEVAFLSYANGEYADDKVQYLNQYKTNSDGTFTIQFRPRESAELGIYKAVAGSMAAGANMTKYYKTAKTITQPVVVTKDAVVSEGTEAVFTVSGYTDDWMNTVTLSADGEKLEKDTDYTVTADAEAKTATLKFKTGDGTKMPVGAQAYTVSLISSDTAYNAINLTVKVNEKEYILSYNGNGGTFAGGTSPALNFVKSELPQALLSEDGIYKNGYTLLGWTKNQDGTGAVYTDISSANFGEIFGGGTAAVLYAKWGVRNYTIAYELDGGENFADAPTQYTIETENLPLGTPVKDKYNFGGWFDNPQFDGSPITEIAKGTTGDKVLYAKWNEETSITIRLDGSDVISELGGSIKFSATVGAHEAAGGEVVWHAGDAEGDESNVPEGVSINEGVLTAAKAAEWTPVTVWATNGAEISNKITVHIDITESGNFAIRGINKADSTVRIRKASDEKVFLIAALYNTDIRGNKMLAQVKICPVTDQVNSKAPVGDVEIPGAFESDLQYDEIRVFMWDGNYINTMRPLCEQFVEIQ